MIRSNSRFHFYLVGMCGTFLPGGNSILHHVQFFYEAGQHLKIIPKQCRKLLHVQTRLPTVKTYHVRTYISPQLIISQHLLEVNLGEKALC